MIKRPVFLVLLFCGMLCVQRVWAQTGRRIEEEARTTLRATETADAASAERVFFDYGSWVNFRFIDYKEDDKDSSSVDVSDSLVWMDTRIWMKAVYITESGDENFVYVRLKDLLIDQRPEDTAGGWDHDGPHLDYAYASVEASPWICMAGRKYFSVGSGLAYSNAHDGIEVAWRSTSLEVRSFLSHTLPHEDNIDVSVPGYDKESDRYFWGSQATGSVGDDHTLYGYLLIQRDYSDERPEDPAHTYTYDSEYYGLGAEGLLNREISYSAELIRQTGRSTVYASDERSDVDAWAAQAGISWAPALATHPRFLASGAFGSGDAERASVTDTRGGNLSGKDRNFLYFGYLLTGYALTPRLSNLYLYRLGVALNPLERVRAFKRLNLAIDYYRYYKHRPAGGIYDGLATEDSRDIGDELDVSVIWPLSSDCMVSLQYGHFFPGAAYPDSVNDHEEYYSASLTFVF